MTEDALIACSLGLRGGMRRVGAILLALGGALSALAQEPVEILIRNGLVVTETGRLQADVRIRGAEIAEIGRNLTPARGARTVDATGKLVLPGGIDTHVHLNPVRTPDDRPGADDFESASRAALAGGITTIGAFIGQNPKRARFTDPRRGRRCRESDHDRGRDPPFHYQRSSEALARRRHDAS